jgi:hypothetical protein
MNTLLQQHQNDLILTFGRRGVTVEDAWEFADRWGAPRVSREATEVAIRKVQWSHEGIPITIRKKARDWLLSRGFSLDIS